MQACLNFRGHELVSSLQGGKRIYGSLVDLNSGTNPGRLEFSNGFSP